MSNDILGGSLRFGYDLSDAMRIESVSVAVTERAGREFDIDQSASPLAVGAFDNDIATVSQELRLRLGSDRWRGFTGVYLERFEGDASVEAGPFGTTETTVDTTTLAWFGEFEVDLSERLSLIAGGRIEYEDNDTVTDDGTTRVASDDDFLAALPKLGLRYQLTPDVGVFAEVRQGYRAGGAGGSLLTGRAFAFDPEFTWTYEAGVRSQWLDGRLRANANVFYVDWTDQQLEVPSGSGQPGDTVVENVGESRQYGAEVELSARVSPRLRLDAGLGLLDTRITDTDASNADLEGNEFSFAPAVSASLGARYDLPRGFYVAGKLSYRSRMYSDAANSAIDETDDRFLLDAGIGIDIGDVTLSVKGTNLLDEDYLDASSRAVTFFNPEGLVAPGDGRRLIAEARVRF